MARSERYRMLARILEFYPDYRLPNLDSIVPLPPADLPPWNGDRDTLLDAARGISHPPSAPPSPSEASLRKGRYFLGPEYRLMPTDDVTSDATAPFTGYWEPFIDDNHPLQGNAGKPVYPGLYQVGERFEHIALSRTTRAPDGDRILRWRNWRTVRHDQGTVSPPVVSGRTRTIAPPVKPMACAASERCPVTGSWQPWMHAEHSMQDAVNQYWRQSWLVVGQTFPNPQIDWLLDVKAEHIIWYLMDSTGIDLIRH